MASFKAIIIDPVGMHARPAALIVGEAGKYKSDITIFSGGKSGNLKSIMTIIALGIHKGAEVEIVATGEDEEAAISGIEKIMKDNKVI
ncbi:phosphocarrier protein Hpr [Spiroplasma syrphidicola EA-1]|uniref:Phosphocarrier protein HPr n=2 Tax=Spiroplasma TaxID=2132 RepID=R4U5H8_9MOLU|nr:MULTISPECIES: HPr family phosphocarrier protein [Spiroplasma]AGM24812.1 phosphocarrier protein Hpr [Spiroplasma chrysopicola DF-1]AGM25843.1 phosphocarrier protein Hpr [Spiroplasma syrphidicola EA-1]